MSERIQDMTQGKPLGLLMRFALPLMVGNICQQLYTMVDTAVVGQFVGVDALAALGAADWFNWLVLGIISGFAQGFCILIAQRFGAGDPLGVRKTAAMSALLGGAAAVVLVVAAQLSVSPVLRLLRTPADVVAGSALYLRICFGGIPVIMAYNILSSILRALGDSKTPLYAMLVAAGINIALDLLFVLAFHWDIAGVAAATIIAQAFSSVYCLLALRKVRIMKMTREDWRLDEGVLHRLTRLGAPMALQNAIIAVGGMAVQYVVNGFGLLFVAGFTATNKLYGILEMAAISYGYAVATFAGQNLGAGRLSRIKKGVHTALWLALATAVAVGALMLIFGRYILMLFISGDSAAQVLQIAYSYLAVMSIFLPVLYLLHLYRSALQGLGDTVMPMVSGIAELVMRVGCALLLPLWVGSTGIFYAEVAAWGGAMIVLILSYVVRMRRLTAAAPKEEPHAA
ncbi:MAG: MATE family efflux transporter [Eubacteriales bacterium]|nr:MATE family efflux transporter [Eubacteriales bacterium]